MTGVKRVDTRELVQKVPTVAVHLENSKKAESEMQGAEEGSNKDCVESMPPLSRLIRDFSSRSTNNGGRFNDFVPGDITRTLPSGDRTT